MSPPPHNPWGTRNHMDWDAPAIVLDARAFGEGDAVATVMTEAHGLHRGLARGGAGRSGAPVWQAGNLVQARWVARLADQLGSFSAELVHPAAALALDDALSLAMLSAACSVAEGALPEREPHPRVFQGLLQFVAHLARGPIMLTELVRWETLLLADLGYGLDLTACAVTGERAGLAFVSPKTGRAVTAAAAGTWATRLLPLPGFLVGANTSSATDWRDGLALTGHFLARDAFGHHHRPVPAARRMLYDRVAALADSDPPEKCTMPDDLTGHIEDTKLTDALSERYLAYALSTIMSRSLPDVRDGLKPVHRRLIYAMHQLRLDPTAGFKKCARVVGDVMGKYHPHGDASIYDAMVRMAQEFAARYPLVEGQGNFGNIDGDNPAAMRYTEARLTQIASAMLTGIDDDTVDFRPTYDGEESEPIVLPAAFPNLLANGSAGIAVGMATSIPPHNAGEVCAAAIHLIRHPEASTADLLRHMPGPDFPTGGVLVEDQAALLAAYETGRGGFRLRAKWEVEKGKHGTWQVVITQIPYQVQKAKLVEQIAQLLEEKKLPLLADVRDESSEDVRLVLEPRTRGVEPEVLMETVFRATALETRFPFNMNVLDAARTPRVMALREVLRSWLDHRHEVLVRRSRHRLAAIERRLEILDGYLIVYLNLDEVIRIIREEDEPKPRLMKRFELTEVQAEAILNMRLRALRKLEEMELRKEHRGLSKERRDIQTLLKDEALRWTRIVEELEATRAKFGDGALGKRRTEIGVAPPVVDVATDAFVEREPLTVVLSDKGWIRAFKGHLADDAELRFKEGDRLKLRLHCQTTDRLTLFGTNGRAYTLKPADLPRGRGDGQPVRLVVDLTNEDDVVALFVPNETGKYLVASDVGRGFIVPVSEFSAEKRTGKQILNLKPGEEAAICVPAEGDHLAVVGDSRKLLVFPLDQVPEMARGAGVILQRYKDGKLADARVFRLADGLTWRLGEKTRTETNLRDWLGERGQAGRLPPNGFPRMPKF
jgi:topoisomerase-4 subunit A